MTTYSVRDGIGGPLRAARSGLATVAIIVFLGISAAPSAARGSSGALFGEPTAVATDAAGDVYLVEWESQSIEKFTAAGHLLARWGSHGTADGKFEVPEGIATDAAGDVYVADTGNERVQKFTGEGSFLASWSLGTAPPSVPAVDGIATDATGHVYIVDGRYNRVEKFTSDGTPITEWAVPAPRDVATDAAGDVYVAYANRIEKFTPDGAPITGWGKKGEGPGQFHDISGIAVDDSGAVYVTDLFNNRVEKFTADGAFITQWGRKGDGAGQFDDPLDIAADPRGNVYVTDFHNDRVEKFTSSGAFITAWGRSPTRPSHSGRKPLVIPATRHSALFRATCPHTNRCTAQVMIRAGNSVLARGRYLIAPNGSRSVRIPLTQAGREALARASRVAAQLSIVDTGSHEQETLPVVLRRGQ